MYSRLVKACNSATFRGTVVVQSHKIRFAIIIVAMFFFKETIIFYYYLMFRKGVCLGCLFKSLIKEGIPCKGVRNYAFKEVSEIIPSNYS
jgi:hypothetical protein